jgi:hypothetical protein
VTEFCAEVQLVAFPEQNMELISCQASTFELVHQALRKCSYLRKAAKMIYSCSEEGLIGTSKEQKKWEQ